MKKDSSYTIITICYLAFLVVFITLGILLALQSYSTYKHNKNTVLSQIISLQSFLSPYMNDYNISKNKYVLDTINQKLTSKQRIKSVSILSKTQGILYSNTKESANKSYDLGLKKYRFNFSSDLELFIFYKVFTHDSLFIFLRTPVIYILLFIISQFIFIVLFSITYKKKPS